MSLRDPDPKSVAIREARLAALGPRPPWWRVFARRRWKRERDAILAMDVSELAAMLREIYTPHIDGLMNRKHVAFAKLSKEGK